MTTQKRVLAVIMGGGRGTRLSPLTLERCKPAVPLAGKYRLLDIPIRSEERRVGKERRSPWAPEPSKKRRHTRLVSDWSSDVCSSDLTRLSPLTLERCKPAVPLAGKYRLVDIPISNCINSEINRIFLLSQINTASLHRHVQGAYQFDPFGGGFVDILSAEQTEKSLDWYQGTADAVRRNL